MNLLQIKMGFDFACIEVYINIEWPENALDQRLKSIFIFSHPSLAWSNMIEQQEAVDNSIIATCEGRYGSKRLLKDIGESVKKLIQT